METQEPLTNQDSSDQEIPDRVLPDFAPGTFAPKPQPASVGRLIRAQGVIEAKLMLRHGEQQLLSVFIPLMIMVMLRFAPFAETFGGLQEGVPLVFAVAATSAGFTGQAIAVAFDRRYGALKRTGASGVPAWVIIAGKILAVCAMVVAQIAVLGTAAALFGFRTSLVGIIFAGISLLAGVAAFTALGLCLGGSLGSEAVLALANLIWFVFLGAVGTASYTQGLGNNGWLNVIPSVALAGGLADSFAHHFPLIPLISLVAWTVVASVAARAWFRFEG